MWRSRRQPRQDRVRGAPGLHPTACGEPELRNDKTHGRQMEVLPDGAENKPMALSSIAIAKPD